MKLAVAILLLGAAPAFAGELPADLVKAVNDYHQAHFNNDLPELERLVSDDYVLVNSDATVEDKRKVLDDHALPGFKTDPYVVQQPVNQAWDNAAVTSGLVHLSWTLDGTHHTRVVRMAHVWAKRNGQWQATYTQVTRVPE
jgi:ketosteroid isomerase-like protein